MDAAQLSYSVAQLAKWDTIPRSVEEALNELGRRIADTSPNVSTMFTHMGNPNQMVIRGLNPAGNYYPSWSVRTITGTFTLSKYQNAILCDTTGGAYAVNLPAASTVPGKLFWIKNHLSSANDVTVTPNGSEKIDNASTAAITFPESIAITNDGSNWYIVAGHRF